MDFRYHQVIVEKVSFTRYWLPDFWIYNNLMKYRTKRSRRWLCEIFFLHQCKTKFPPPIFVSLLTWPLESQKLHSNNCSAAMIITLKICEIRPPAIKSRRLLSTLSIIWVISLQKKIEVCWTWASWVEVYVTLSKSNVGNMSWSLSNAAKVRPNTGKLGWSLSNTVEVCWMRTSWVEVCRTLSKFV